jgi:hypothetical protein
MLRRAVGLALALAFLGGVALADDKDKAKGKAKESRKAEFDKALKASHKATVTKVDFDKKVLSVKSEGKSTDYTVTKDVKFYGPKGGKRTFKDLTRLKAGAEVRIVDDGKALKAVILPAKSRSKPKDKPKKDKKG